MNGLSRVPRPHYAISPISITGIQMFKLQCFSTFEHRLSHCVYDCRRHPTSCPPAKDSAIRLRLPITASSNPRKSFAFSDYQFVLWVMFSPGSDSHYPVLLARIHEDKSLRRQRVLARLLLRDPS